jgi:hypothetical protein
MFRAIETFVSFDIGCDSIGIAKCDRVLENIWRLPISVFDLIKARNVETAQMTRKGIVD